MNNLIIVGNGFDLAHGLETSYEHFVKYLFESNHFSTSKIHKHPQLFKNRLLNTYEEFKKRSQTSYIDPVAIHFLNELLKDILLNNWCDIEEKYFEVLLKVGSSDRYLYQKPKKLNLEFELLKEALIDYLSTQEDKSIPIESYKKFFNTIDSKETVILNFNYTNTLQRLYSGSLKLSKIIHIHGELNSELNPIVFGYAASDSESRMLLEKSDNEFMRNIKKHLYKHAENESLLSTYLSGTKKIDVQILGHSCGQSDKLILNQILNDKNVDTIRSFYYENYEHYFNTMVNVDRIMIEDEKFRKRIVDFNSSHRMPQINDSNEQKMSFINYIDLVQKVQFKQRPYPSGAIM